MNEIQKQTLKEIQNIIPGSRFINIEIRGGGKYYKFEADFLREIILNFKCETEEKVEILPGYLERNRNC